MNFASLLPVCISVVILYSKFGITTDNETVWVPKEDILDQLGHIENETIRNITAIQLYVCPTSQTCTANLDLGLENKHMEASRNCCSPCSCMPDCFESSSCCVDYPGSMNMPPDKSILDLYQCVYPHYTPINVLQQNHKHWMISTCPTNDSLTGRGGSYRWLCESDYQSIWLQGHYRHGIPVTDKVHMVTYKNMFCALCHGLQHNDVILWTVSVQSYIPYIKPDDTIEDIVNHVETYTSDLNIIFLPPNNVPPETYTCIVDTCNETGDWEQYNLLIEKGCQLYTNIYEKKFKNIFCAMCNSKIISVENCDILQEDEFGVFFSYIGILDFNVLDPQGQTEQPGQRKQNCEDGYHWDKVTRKCRKLSCPILLQLIDNECQLLYTKVHGQVFVLELTYINRESRLPLTNRDIRELYKNLTDDIQDTSLYKMLEKMAMHSFHVNTDLKVLFQSEFMETGQHTYKHVRTNTIGINAKVGLYVTKTDVQLDIISILRESKKLYAIPTYMSFRAVHNTKLIMHKTQTLLANNSLSKLNNQFKSHVDELKHKLNLPTFAWSYDYDYYNDNDDDDDDISPATNDSFKKSNTYITYKVTEMIDFGDFQYRKLPTDDSLTISPLPLCTYIQFDHSEYTVLDTDVHIKAVDLTIQQNQVTLCGNQAMLCVCLDIYEEAVNQYLRTHPSDKQTAEFSIIYTTETIMSLTFSSISILSNILTLTVYLLLKQLRTTPGLITITLTIHLTIFQIIYVLSNSVNLIKFTNVCIGVGIALHFSFLSYVFWMNVSTFHMFQTFTKTGINSFNKSKFHPIKLLIKYSMYVYMSTLTFVGINILVSMATTDWSDLGYGFSSCYINTSLMTGVTSGLPLGTVLLSNIYLFVRTMHFVVSGNDVTVTRSGGIDDRTYLIAFIKLSLLTGVTWLLGLLHQWTGVHVIGFSYIVLNAGQGVLIFVAFVCNKHIFSMLKATCSNV